MKVWKVALVSILTLGLVLGMASPALAAPPWASSPPAAPPSPRVIRGEVASIADTSFVVKSGWSEVTVLVDGETEYFRASVPAGALTIASRLVKPDEPSSEGLGLRQRLHRLVAGVLASVPTLVRNRLEMRLEVCAGLGVGRLLSPFGEEATFDDIEVGSWVVVWAVADGDNPLAKRVVITEPTTCHHLVGTILGIDTDGKTITITSDDGESIVLSYGEETCFILRGSISLEVGDSVRAVYDEGGMAKAVVVITGSD
jgi:hypothetical protein